MLSRPRYIEYACYVNIIICYQGQGTQNMPAMSISSYVIKAKVRRICLLCQYNPMLSRPRYIEYACYVNIIICYQGQGTQNMPAMSISSYVIKAKVRRICLLCQYNHMLSRPRYAEYACYVNIIICYQGQGTQNMPAMSISSYVIKAKVRRICLLCQYHHMLSRPRYAEYACYVNIIICYQGQGTQNMPAMSI